MSDPALEAVKRALAICGGARVLCARLGVNVTKLHAWIDGEEIPRAHLLKIVEIVLTDYDAWRAQDRRSEPRTRTRDRRRHSASVL
jgi:hypothetical protein